MTSPLLFLALPSTAALGLLLVYLGANRGRRAALAYLGAAAVYGLLRGTAIHWISDHRLGSPFPYRIHLPVLAFGGVSLQEVVGWSLAAGLAWVLADRLLARLGRFSAVAGPGPGSWTTAALAALVLAAVCLAVENAAIRAGWWSWTIALPGAGSLVPVPRVALLDWGFVAFDFLLPWLLFAVPAPLGSRLAALAVFPLHMLAHTLLAPLPEPLPLAGNDLLHAGIVAYVLVRAIGEPGTSTLPPPERERLRHLPLAVAAIVAGASAAAAWRATGEMGAVLPSLPLLALAAGTVRVGKLKEWSKEQPPPKTSRLAWRIAVVLLVLVGVYALRAPASRRQRDFVRGLERGVAALNAGDATAAEAALRTALQARPDQTGARTLLAMALLRQGRRADARSELEAALAAAPEERDPLILLTSLDLAEGRTAAAAERAARGRRAHPERPEPAYQAALAAGTAGPGRPPAKEAIALARRGGRGMLSSLASLADAFQDRATGDECRAALAALP